MSEVLVRRITSLVLYRLLTQKYNHWTAMKELGGESTVNGSCGTYFGTKTSQKPGSSEI